MTTGAEMGTGCLSFSAIRGRRGAYSTIVVRETLSSYFCMIVKVLHGPDKLGEKAVCELDTAREAYVGALTGSLLHELDHGITASCRS
jgi:hypothetical protein